MINLFFLSLVDWFNLNRLKIFKWVLIGFVLLFVSNLIAFFLVEFFSIPFFYSSIFSALICNLLRFFINNFWVFKDNSFSFYKFYKFQISSGFSFVVWWSFANTLVYFGVFYLLALNIAAILSTLINLFVNFLWVWRNVDLIDSKL